MKGSSEVLRELQERHRNLDMELHVLERRAFLTPDEQRQATVLKKRKLATKDRIYALKRQTVD